MSYRNFATLILNDVTWKQVFSEFHVSFGEIEFSKLAYMPKFKYPSKKAYCCPLPTDSEQAMNVYFEFKVSRLSSFNRTIHIELSESHFKLIVQITRITSKHAKFHLYCDDFDFQRLINPKKLLVDLIKQVYSNDWRQTI